MFNAVDVAALIVLAIGIFQGMQRRLSGELAHLIGVAVAFVVGVFSYRPLGAWLEAGGWIAGRGGQAVAFLAAVVAAALAMVAVRSLLRRLLGAAIEEGTDRTAGAIAGGVRSAIFVLIVFLAMNLVPQAYLNRVFGDESAIGRVVQVFIPGIREKYPDLDLDPERLEQIKNGAKFYKEDAGGDPVPVRHR